jgi:hypothetical protein
MLGVKALMGFSLSSESSGLYHHSHIPFLSQQGLQFVLMHYVCMKNLAIAQCLFM